MLSINASKEITSQVPQRTFVDCLCKIVHRLRCIVYHQLTVKALKELIQ